MSVNKFTFSIIVPHRAEEKVEGVKSIHRQKRYQVEAFAVSGNLPSAQRNKGVDKASGDIIYFLDNDSIPVNTNMELASEIFDRYPHVAVVGGPSITPVGDSLVQHAFGYVLGSFWGSFFVRARYKQLGKPRFCTDRELILCNMFVRRELFVQLGGFNEELYPNEENELMDRFREQGYRLFYHPRIGVERSQRPDFSAFVRQLLGYGRGRSEQMRVAFSLGNLPFFAFMLFPVYLFAIPFILLLQPWGAVLLAIYVSVIMLAALPAIKKGVRFFLYVLTSFFLSHFCYGLGMWRGFFGKLRSSLSKVHVSCRKLFGFKK